MFMLIYVSGTIIILMFICFLLLTNQCEKLYLKYRLSYYELMDIYTHTKREFNLKTYKILTKSIIIEKCGNVNNIWKGLPCSTKIDITEWSLVFAMHYISINKLRFNYNKTDLIKLKWKYKSKYLLIKFIMRHK